MTYLVIQTRTADWAEGGEFSMVASTDFDEANHMYDKWVANNGGGYGQQSGTVVRLVLAQGNTLRNMRKVDFRDGRH